MQAPPRTPRRQRLTALAVEVCASLVGLFGVSLWSLPLALVLGGLLAMVAAALWEAGRLI